MPDFFDVVIENGTVVDGTGKKSYGADIGIRGGKITAIETSGDVLKKAASNRRIDAAGKTVCPGFIDVHCHTDAYAQYYPDAEGKLMQGVTTDLCGLCGSSPVPIGTGNLQEYLSRNLRFIPEEKFQHIEPLSFKDYLDALNSRGNSTHMALFVGNSNLRIHAIGYENKIAEADSLAAMQEMLRRCMDEGAFGLSSGLTYVPSLFASAEELTELCKVMRPYGGIYNSHMRNESDRVAEAVAEVIHIAEKSGCRGHVSHLKVMGRENHGRAGESLELIERANDRGVPVAFDIYPYTAGSTALKTLLPDWVLLQGWGDFSVLREKKGAILRELEESRNKNGKKWDSIVFLCGYDGIVVSSAKGQAEYEGKSISQIAQNLKTDPYDAIVRVLEETEGHAEMIYHSMSEEDLCTFMKSKYCMIGTDAYARHYVGPTAQGKPHPRNYGGFPRYFRRYVLKKRLFSLEEGIYKVTGLPAQIFNLKGRGTLKVGNYGDVTVFDPERIADTATWERPAQKPKGIEYVLVNGKIAAERGEALSVRAGRGLVHER